MRKIILLTFIFNLLFIHLGIAAITTPYPTVITLKQINGAEKERVRLAQAHKKYDRQPTGFYIESGKSVVVNVEILTPAIDGAMPVLTIGTLGFNVDGRVKNEIPLQTGLNTITSSQHSGGLIYLSFITNAARDPKGEVRITFTDAGEQVRVPRYIYGVTTDAEFVEMMTEYPTPDVLFQSDYFIAVATRNAANQYAKLVVKQKWMDDIHTLLANEDTISGLDNNDPNPVHHRLKAGEVRFLLTQNTSTSPHANSEGYTGYPSASIHRYLTPFNTSNNLPWMLGHELGHQHQQSAYMINKATESTVNIYSYVEERYFEEATFPGFTYNRTSAERWATTQNTYLKLPVEERIYDIDDADMEAIVGFNRDELRFMVWEQLFLLFGDDFYKTLHRIVREEKVSSGGSADDRRYYLILKASQVSGYDLREFFNQWGIRIYDDTALKNKLAAYFSAGLANGTIVALPQSMDAVIGITGQQRPAWSPLPLRGITSSVPEEDYFDRSNWTITTSIAGPADATVGGENPMNIIDGDFISAFAFVKPGRSYGGITVPGDHIPSFTINMGKQETFNCFKYRHRTASNTSEYLRARKISFYGKNAEGDSFTPIIENVFIDPVVNKDEIKVLFSSVSYQYVQLVINEWNVDNGSTIQVSEFNIGNSQPEIGTGISEKPMAETPISVYPNPIRVGQPFYVRSGNESDVKNIQLFNLSGQPVKTISAPGIYLVRTNTGRQTVKLIVTP